MPAQYASDVFEKTVAEFFGDLRLSVFRAPYEVISQAGIG